MDDVSSILRLDGIPVVRTAQELEQHLTTPSTSPGSSDAGQPEASSSAWVCLSPPLLPAAFLLERADGDQSPVGRVAQAIRILCEALNRGCAETLMRGYHALQDEVDPRGARQRQWLRPCSPDARTPYFVVEAPPEGDVSDETGVMAAIPALEPDAELSPDTETAGCLSETIAAAPMEAREDFERIVSRGKSYL